MGETVGAKALHCLTLGLSVHHAGRIDMAQQVMRYGRGMQSPRLLESSCAVLPPKTI